MTAGSRDPQYTRLGRSEKASDAVPLPQHLGNLRHVSHDLAAPGAVTAVTFHDTTPATPRTKARNGSNAEWARSSSVC